VRLVCVKCGLEGTEVCSASFFLWINKIHCRTVIKSIYIELDKLEACLCLAMLNKKVNK
jgi:hypothetical protein